MSKNENVPNISKELLDEYFLKKEQRNIISDECKNLSEKIKYEMNKVGRKEINLHGYKIYLETKHEPTEDFFNLLERKGLSYLINKTITGNHMKTATKILKLSDDKLLTLLREKTTKWLHVDKL